MFCYLFILIIKNTRPINEFLIIIYFFKYIGIKNYELRCVILLQSTQMRVY